MARQSRAEGASSADALAQKSDGTGAAMIDNFFVREHKRRSGIYGTRAAVNNAVSRQVNKIRR